VPPSANAEGAADAEAALAAPDPDLARERAETAAARAAEARGDFGRPAPEADHRAALDGLLAAGLQRPSACGVAGRAGKPAGAAVACRSR
jgi:hypothetical protein